MPRRPTLPALTLVGLLLAATGCSSDASADGNGTRVEGGSIVYATDREPTCLDPHNSGDMPQTYVARQFLDSLVSATDDGQVVPWLADSWVISPDGLNYDFTLKQGVRFTDGEPFDADAVVANFDQILDPATQSSTDLLYLTSYFKGAVALDENTVRIELLRPYSPLLIALSQAFFGMESPKAMARGLEENCESPVGTGPFVVAKWNRARDVELVRNDDYTSAPANAKHQGPAYLESITWRFLKDNTTRYSALTGGQAQVIFNLPAESQEAAESNEDLELQDFVHSGSPFSLDLNTRSVVFQDERVRQAFIHASNAEAAVKSAYGGVYPFEGNTISSGTPFYSEASHDPWPYDQDTANDLLDAAGWTGRDDEGYRTKDGKRLKVLLPYNSDSGETPPGDLTILQNIQAQEKLVGVEVELQPLDSSSINSVWGDATKYDALGTYWNSPTPHVMYIQFSQATLEVDNGQNVPFAADPAVDDLLLQATATTDPTQQSALYAQAQQLITGKAWAIGLYPIQTRLAIRKDLKDVWIETSEGEPVLHDAYLVE